MLENKGLLELADLLEKKEISSTDIAKDLIEKINLINPGINAYVDFNPADVLNASNEADNRRKAGKALSKFDGIPVAIKDNICTTEGKTTCGSKILNNFKAPYDATVITKMRNAGFINLGKVNMDEFAMGSTTENSFYGPTRNPYNKDYVPGGSSGGSAAAVAARLAPAALGSDTGGSIRQPAAFCGVVGIKPTYGRVSRYGLVAFASSLDQIGTFGRNVDDAAALLSVISGGDKLDSTSIDRPVDFTSDNINGDIRGMKLGIPKEYYKGVDPEIKNAIDSKIAILEKNGAIIEEISLQYTEYAIPVYYLLATAEASSNLARFDGVRYGYRSEKASTLEELYLNTRSEGFGSEVKRRIILGTYSLSSGYYDAYYLRAMKGRTMIINDFKNAFSKVDAILTPVAPSTAFKLGEKINNPLEMYISDILTISANLAAIPGVSVPIGLDSKGLPIGMQIMGNHFEEKKMLNVAKAIESISTIAGPSL